MGTKKFRFAGDTTLLFIIVTLIALAIRYRTTGFIQNSLWAEDGLIFFNGANFDGIKSLIEPYAGYLHIYPRLIALIAALFTPSTTPYIFFTGWFISILLIRWTIKTSLDDSKNSQKLAFLIPLTLLFMPHSGETFLSLTNAQWWLAISLAIMACTPDKFGVKTIPLVLLLSLTGPFCVLFIPICLIRSVQTKRYSVVAAMLIGAIVQAACLLANPRPSNPAGWDMDHWADLSMRLFLFGKPNTFTCIAAIVFWLATIVAFRKADARYKALLACAVIVFVPAIYAMKSSIENFSPYSDGSRYFVVPYALLAIANFIFMNKRRASTVACIALALIFASSQRLPHQDSRHFQYYAKLAQHEDTLIPILPRTSLIPGFVMQVNPSAPQKIAGSDYQMVDGSVVIAKNACQDNRGVAFAGTIDTPMPTRIQMVVKSGEKEAIEIRNYAAGEQRIQLATTKRPAAADVIIQVNEAIGSATISDAYFICL